MSVDDVAVELGADLHRGIDALCRGYTTRVVLPALVSLAALALAIAFALILII
jgi:hypothetical protein